MNKYNTGSSGYMVCGPFNPFALVDGPPLTHSAMVDHNVKAQLDLRENIDPDNDWTDLLFVGEEERGRRD